MEHGSVAFSEFVRQAKAKVAQILQAFFSNALPGNQLASFYQEVKKTNPFLSAYTFEDPRFLVTVLTKNWRKVFELQVPNSSTLTAKFEKVRELFNIDAHSSSPSWTDINYYVECLIDGLRMFATFPGQYRVADASDASKHIQSTWKRVEKRGDYLNPDVKWEARLEDVYLPGLSGEDLSVLLTQVPLAATSDQVVSALNSILGVLVTQKPKTTNQNKYIIRHLPSGISIDLLKQCIKDQLDVEVKDLSENGDELELVLSSYESNVEPSSVTIRKQKILLEPVDNASKKLIVYGAPTEYDSFKVEQLLDDCLNIKCHVEKASPDSDVAVLILHQSVDLNTLLQAKHLKTAKGTLYFQAYCDYVLKVLGPIGATSENLTRVLMSVSKEWQLVQYFEQTRVGYVHCASSEVKQFLLAAYKDGLPLINMEPLPTRQASVQAPLPSAAPKPKPSNPQPSALPSFDQSLTPSFVDANSFAKATAGNGKTEIKFTNLGDLPGIQAKSFNIISDICDQKSINYTIIDGSRIQFSTAIPSDVKMLMQAIEQYLKDKTKDRVTVGEADKQYTYLYKLMAKHLTSTTNCHITIGVKQSKINSQKDFIEVFLFGCKADFDQVKQSLLLYKSPSTKTFTLSEEDTKIVSELDLSAIKSELVVDFTLNNTSLHARALSMAHIDRLWQHIENEIKKRKEATKLSSEPCLIDYFDNYMRSDFQNMMFLHKLSSVTIQTRFNKFIFNGPRQATEQVKAELEAQLSKLVTREWKEKIDGDLARYIFSSKKVQRVLQEHNVSYYFIGKNSYLDKDNNNNNARKAREARRATGSKGSKEFKSAQSKQHTPKQANSPKSHDTNPKSATNAYFNKNVVMRDIHLVSSNINELNKCTAELTKVLTIKSTPRLIQGAVTRYIVDNVKDLEKKYKVIIRRKSYLLDEESANSDSSDSDSDPIVDQHQVSPMPTCWITGIDANVAKAIAHINSYEDSISCRQPFKLAPVQFQFVERFLSDEIEQLAKLSNVQLRWPAKLNKNSPKKQPLKENSLEISGKKSSVDGFMQKLLQIKNSIFERSTETPKNIPMGLLRLEKKDLEERYRVIVALPEDDTSPTTNITIVGDKANVVRVSDLITGPYTTKTIKFTPQQYSLLYQEMVDLKEIKNFKIEYTVHAELVNKSKEILLIGRDDCIQAAQKALEIQLAGKFAKEVIQVSQKLQYFLKKKFKNEFDAAIAQGRPGIRFSTGELIITGDATAVAAAKLNLTNLIKKINDVLVVARNSSHRWRLGLSSDFKRQLCKDYNLWIDSVKSKPLQFEYGFVELINGIKIRVKKGDIFEESADALISCDNAMLQPKGGIAKAISDKTGPIMAIECDRYLSQYGQLGTGNAMTTSAGVLKSFKSVIHVVGPMYQGGKSNESVLLANAVRAVISQATCHNMSKIVMPSISTGVFGYPKSEAAQVIAQTLVTELANLNSPLKEIIFIDQDEEILDCFCSALKALEQGYSTVAPVTIKQQWFWCEDNGQYIPYDVDQNNEIEYAYQSGQKSVLVVGDLNKVKNGGNYEVSFVTMEQRNVKTGFRRRLAAQELPASNWCQLDRFPKAILIKRVDFSVKPVGGTDALELTGVQQDLDQAIAQIKVQIAALKRTVTMDFHGNLDDKQIEFLQSLGVTFKLEKQRLTLKGLQEALDRAQLSLMTAAGATVTYPDNWDDQTTNCHVVPLSSQSQEWTNVVHHFKLTIPGAQVLKIERIQNKVIWDHYMCHVQKLKKTSGNTKQLNLFHGTRNTNPELIYRDDTGFLNQYSSAQNLWGFGNYFAVNSSYSNAYAHNLSDGSKQMFLAQVLVGEPYPAGSQQDPTLRLPPPKPGQQNNNGTTARYDSVEGFTQGSTVYIVYENGRAYPAYLITYK